MRTKTKNDWEGIDDLTNNQINDFYMLNLMGKKVKYRHLKVQGQGLCQNSEQNLVYF
jgi:hypothetical protein